MNDEKNDPDATYLAGQHREQCARCGQSANTEPRNRARQSLRFQKQQPAGSGKEKSEAIGATRNVVNCRTVNWVNNPKQRNDKRAAGDPGQSPLCAISKFKTKMPKKKRS